MRSKGGLATSASRRRGAWPRGCENTARSIGSRFVVPSLILAFFSLLFSASVALADSASVLPKGRSTASVDNLFYFPTTQRWNTHGNAEDIAAAFDNRNLDSSVFPLLAALNPFVPGGNASIGTSSVDFTYNYNILDFGFAYGITDRLTAGIDIPQYTVHNKVGASLTGSGANVGLSTGSGGPCGNAPVRPLLIPGTTIPCPNTRRFTTGDVQQLLGPGIQTPTGSVPGFGFKPVQDFRADGLGDITAALKYQYLRTEDWRLAATLGARFPTGRQDDPNNLADIPWSPGNYAVLLRLHHDYVISNLWKGRPAAETPILREGDLVLNFTFRFDWNLPTDVTVRVGTPDNPITRNEEPVTRDFGDKFEFELAAKYELVQGFSVSALYKYGFKLEDRITSNPLGFPVQVLEKDTDSTEQLFIIGFNYSTLPLYLEKKFPIPLDISLVYRDRFAGSGPSNAASPSQILKTRYIGLGLAVRF